MKTVCAIMSHFDTRMYKKKSIFRFDYPIRSFLMMSEWWWMTLFILANLCLLSDCETFHKAKPEFFSGFASCTERDQCFIVCHFTLLESLYDTMQAHVPGPARHQNGAQCLRASLMCVGSYPLSFPAIHSMWGREPQQASWSGELNLKVD